MTIIYKYRKGTRTKKEAQEILDVYTKWSKETGLKFNVNKCEKITVGGTHKAKEDLILLGKPMKNQAKLKILGLFITRNGINPLKNNKIRAKYSSRTNYDRIKQYYKKATFEEMKILWTSYLEAKSLYGSESFSRATIKKVGENEYEIIEKEDWLKIIDTGYKKTFSNKNPRKGSEEAKWKSIPLLPSKRAIARSLLEVMTIITGKGEKYGLNKEGFLPVITTDRNTRINTKTLLERSLESSNHDRKDYLL